MISSRRDESLFRAHRIARHHQDAPRSRPPRFSDWSIRADRESAARADCPERCPRRPHRSRRSSENDARVSAAASRSADARIDSSCAPMPIRLETHSVRQSRITPSARDSSAASAMRRIERLLDGHEMRRARRLVMRDARRHLDVERLAGRDEIEAVALERLRERDRMRAFSAARAAGDKRNAFHRASSVHDARRA